jgi:hypothetical protein
MSDIHSPRMDCPAMTLHQLITKPEFWSALFGALAAFLLGSLGTWWAATNTKRTAGNLSLVALSQMYALMENLRYKLFVDEPIRFFAIAKQAPLSFQLRAAIGLPTQPPHVPMDQLGFLADSHDPDVMSRLLTVERAFTQMLDLARRHEQLHSELQSKLNDTDPTGQRLLRAQDIVSIVGAKLLIEIDDAVEEMHTGLPETRDALLAVGNQMRRTLQLQFPMRKFVGFTPAPRSRTMDQPPDLLRPALWRRIVRWSVDVLRKPRRLPWRGVSPSVVSPPEPQPPTVKRFPTRSYAEPAAGQTSR